VYAAFFGDGMLLQTAIQEKYSASAKIGAIGWIGALR
jgi:hypothetical protein